MDYIDKYLEKPTYKHKEIVVRKAPNGEVKEVIKKIKYEPLKVSEIKILLDIKERRDSNNTDDDIQI